MREKIEKLTPKEVERIRLILSTYQDGTGMLANRDGTSLPGWRDFERTVGIVMFGRNQEDKSVFDVIVPSKGDSKTGTGVSCKMRRELSKVDTIGRVCFELSNSAGQFWDHLKLKGINQKNYRKYPAKVGFALLELVKTWHEEVGIHKGGSIDLSKSFYLVLLWDKAGEYQCYQFAITLPEPKTLKWYFPSARCLRGDDKAGTIFEWYGESGGQLKYYPLAAEALWCSKRFKLEPLQEKKHAVVEKVKAYFPHLWKKVFGNS